MIQAHSSNYRAGRTGKIEYIVVHYTANNGDTAKNNCDYFAGANRGASAHYFVDENEWQQSVKDGDTAWHCGAQSYKHPACRNANALGVELCSRKDANGQYYFLPQTVRNAQQLVRELQQKYNVPVDHVLRHYDVTGKNCPAPFVEHPAQWTDFLEALQEKEQEEADMTETEVRNIIEKMAQEAAAEPPAGWSIEAREWAEEKGIIQGSDKGMQYQAPCTREQMAVMLYRFWKLLQAK